MKHTPALSMTTRILLLGILIFALTGCSQGLFSSIIPPAPIKVEIAYRNHPPVVAVLKDVDTLLAKYDKQIQVSRVDVDTPEGESFLKDKKVTDPTVLAIFIDGTMTYDQVQFFSFPVGKGTAMTKAGNWTLDDLNAALAAATSQKK
jgi:hypothetical protein